MRGATAPRLLLEVVCARLLLPSASDTESALLQRIERIETRLDVSIPSNEAAQAMAAAAPSKQFVRPSRAEQAAPAAAPEPAPQPKPEPEPQPVAQVRPEPEPEPEPEPVSVPEPEPVPEPVVAQPVPAQSVGEPDAAAVRSMWNTVREKGNGRSKAVNAMLADAIVRTVDGGALVLSHPAPTLVKRLGESKNAEIIRDALKDALGVDWQIRCVPDSGEPEAAGAAPTQPDPRAEEERMLAEASSDTTEVVRRDPEEAAIELLQNELGARRIDKG